jgi:hypothetical protein
MASTRLVVEPIMKSAVTDTLCAVSCWMACKAGLLDVRWLVSRLGGCHTVRMRSCVRMDGGLGSHPQARASTREEPPRTRPSGKSVEVSCIWGGRSCQCPCLSCRLRSWRSAAEGGLSGCACGCRRWCGTPSTLTAPWRTGGTPPGFCATRTRRSWSWWAPAPRAEMRLFAEDVDRLGGRGRSERSAPRVEMRLFAEDVDRLMGRHRAAARHGLWGGWGFVTPVRACSIEMSLSVSEDADRLGDRGRDERWLCQSEKVCIRGHRQRRRSRRALAPSNWGFVKDINRLGGCRDPPQEADKGLEGALLG